MSLNVNKRNVSEIDDILTDLSNRINLIDYRFPQAHSAAQQLLDELREAHSNYDGALHNVEKAPKIAKIAFNSACKAANERVFSILERDLGWGIYLWNIQKKLTSNDVTLAAHTGFFTQTPTRTAASVGQRFMAFTESASKVASPLLMALP